MPQAVSSVAEQRSRIMRAVPRANTTPEVAVRKALHSLGFRFRLHRRDLPGTPDIVLPRHRLVIFVHGCFWHRHDDCRRTTNPKTRVEFWQNKFETNVARDRVVASSLESAGWRVLVVWECETKDDRSLVKSLQASLPRDGASKPSQRTIVTNT